ncbi:MAG: hypothetical protein GY941_15660, partial [Planctomycetes bacterium]|nr:hypothetical protein [Planctomycetota bacterium]
MSLIDEDVQKIIDNAYDLGVMAGIDIAAHERGFGNEPEHTRILLNRKSNYRYS